MQSRQIVLVLAVIGSFGVFLPLYKGLDFLDPRLIVAYSLLSAVIAASSIADAISSETGGSGLQRMLRVWLFSWGLALLLMAIALFTVNVRNWHGHAILPRTSFLIACECISATAAAAVVAFGALLTVRISSGKTKTAFRAIFLIAILGLVVADRYGVETPPTETITRWLFIASGICVCAAVVLASRYPRTQGPNSTAS